MPNHPTPTALKLIAGNPGKRPIVADDFQPTGAAMKPKWLKGKASARWDALAPELTAAGVLTAVDADLFAAFCVLAAEFEQSEGLMIAGRIAQMRALAGSFGLDPASRTRIHVMPKPAAHGVADKYFP